MDNEEYRIPPERVGSCKEGSLSSNEFILLLTFEFQ
jgi:hypothetical protein